MSTHGTLTPEELLERIDRLPRVPAAFLPTPLQPCPRLGADLGGIKLWVKRDDMTGVALGGNKSRQLDFILGKAVAGGATAILTTAAVQSNQCRQTASAAARLGLPVFMVLRGDRPATPEANYLLDMLFGAEIRFMSSDRSNEEVTGAIAEWRADLERRGLRPYFVDLINYWSESSVLGAVAYAGMVAEVVRQLGDTPGPVAFYLNCGSEGSATLAGSYVGCRALGMAGRVVGIPADRVGMAVEEETRHIARAAFALLGLEESALPPVEMAFEHRFSGEGYGVASAEGMDAIRLAASTEGLLLEPVYTGKALAALVAAARSGAFSPDERVVFLHTGGAPLLFLDRFAGLLAG